MTIDYDAVRRRATHIESGLAIEFDRAGAHPMEREEFFRLIWQGRSYPFKASINFGDAKIKRANPALPPNELFTKLVELNEKNWLVTSLPMSVPAAIGATHAFGEVFVAVMHALVEQTDGGSSRKSVTLRPAGDSREWSVQC